MFSLSREGSDYDTDSRPLSLVIRKNSILMALDDALLS